MSQPYCDTDSKATLKPSILRDTENGQNSQNQGVENGNKLEVK